MMREKLANRRQKQEDKEYEEDAALALIQNAEKMLSKRDEDAQMMKEKQTSLVSSIHFNQILPFSSQGGGGSLTS